MRTPRSFVAAACAFVALCACPGVADAYDVEVAATTAAQAYEVRGPNGTPILARRRITQTLRLGAYGLVPRRPKSPQIDAQVLLRLDADFGMEGEETDPEDARAFVPLLEDREVDLAFGYVDGRGFLNGWLDFRVGRQILYDPLGLYAFDGGLVRVVTPYWFAIEAYGGLETQQGSPLGPSRWGRDGTQEDDANALAYPSLKEPHLDPVFGVTLASSGYFPLHSRFTFRETQAAEGLGERRAGWAGDYTPIDSMTFRGQLVYDLGLEVLSEAQVGYEVAVAKPVTVSLDYVYFLPTFSMDSIWNYFSVQPMNDGRVGVRFRPIGRLQLAALGFVRFFGDDGAGAGRGSFPWTPQSAVSDMGGDLEGRIRNETSEALVRLHAADGFGGTRTGVEVYLVQRFLNDKFRAELMPSLWFYEDDLREAAADPVRASATSFSYVVGGAYQYSKEANLHLQYEHSINRIVGNRFRLLAILDLRFWM